MQSNARSCRRSELCGKVSHEPIWPFYRALLLPLADSEFLRRGDANPKLGNASLIFWQFFPENGMIRQWLPFAPCAVADLGFPRGGCANPRGGGANLLFDQFFLKTAWKWRNFGPEVGARVPCAPLRSATAVDPLLSTQWNRSVADRRGLLQFLSFHWNF